MQIKTEHKLAKALKEMMSKQPLDSISVMSLAKACNVNRKTFYYHFHDIYDLLTQVFLDEKIPGIKDVTDINSLNKKIFDYYSENKNFIDATLSSAGRDLFEEFMYNTCYQSFIKFINSNSNSKKIAIIDKKSIARFYASGYSSLIVFYLSNYRIKSLDGLKKFTSFLGIKFLDTAIKRVIEIREKEQK